MQHFHISRLFVLLTFLLISTIPNLQAQYSEKAFILKKAQELYDERGFQQGKALSVDGKLIVSESNGNVSYSYPISEHTVHGYPLKVSLNYCGSVPFTAYRDYHTGEMIRWGSVDDGPGKYVYGPAQRWSRFHQNRAAWLVGVNGFAVQALSVASHFHMKPNVVFEAKGETSSNRLEYNDDDVIWTIDGYDVCNRMRNITQGEDQEGFTNHAFVDVIRLLREDGSVLELFNAKRSDTTNFDLWNEQMYIGWYVPYEANNKGFAIVSYLPMPSIINDYEADYTHPRMVRWYPGDGLEYVFYENVIPYGTEDFKGTYMFGGAKAYPSIFYLEEINCGAGRITKFQRPRHYEYLQGTGSLNVFPDSTAGRSIITQFDGHTIGYSEVGILIEALGRTTEVWIDSVSRSGEAAAGPGMPLPAYGYRGATGYHSYVGYVSKIKDPEGRVTKFTYEPYVKKYYGIGFPKETYNASLTLKNFRLKTIQEPTARYELAYYKHRPLDPNPPGDTVIIESTTKDQFLIQNIVDTVKKYEGTTLLTTDRYGFHFDNDTVFIDRSDHRSGTSTYTEFKYKKHHLPPYVGGLVPPRHTEVWRVERRAGGDTVVTTSRQETTSENQYIWFPLESIETVNGLEKTQTIYSYNFETVRNFEGDTRLQDFFGKDIASIWTEILCPCPGCDTLDIHPDLYRRTKTSYLNLPLIDTTIITIDSARIDKIATYKRYLELLAANDPTVRGKRFEDVGYHPNVFRGDHDTVRTIAPPFFGLTSYSESKDLFRDLIVGKGYRYQTNFTADYYAPPRGTLLADSIYGSNASGSYTTPPTTYRYVRSGGHLLPDSTVTPLGAVAQQFYRYSFPASGITNRDTLPTPMRLSGNILDFSNRVTPYNLKLAEYYSYSFEEPSVDRLYVRKMVPGVGNNVVLATTTLDSYTERGLYGLPIGTVDPNGWYSRYNYDNNGRLRTLYLPYDFTRTDTTRTQDEQGRESFYGAGISMEKWRWDTLLCNTDCEQVSIVGGTTQAIHYRLTSLFSDNPTIGVNCYGPIDGINEKGGPALQRSCNAPLPFVNKIPTEGEVSFDLMPQDTNSTLSILAIDSAWVQLYVAEVSDTCVAVEFNIPAFDITRSIIFNCDALGNTDSLGYTIETDSLGRTILRFDLNDYVDSLLVLANSRGGLGMTFQVTTLGGYITFESGFDAEDVRPQIIIDGEYRRRYRFDDYTLSYTYNDPALTTTIHAKVDDTLHSANRIDWDISGSHRRLNKSQHSFGADYRLKTSRVWIGNPNSATRIDSVLTDHTGTGLAQKTTNQLGDTVVTEYDGLGRPVRTINPDGTERRLRYRYGTPSSFGVGDQFYHCDFVAAVSELREDSIISVSYSDAFGRKRRTVADSGGLHYVTRYEYDELDRLRMVISPSSDTTRYWYDAIGRVRYKSQPDLGLISYAYDAVGNVRFTQTQAQADSGRMTFNQYDDLNRLTLVGEMIYEPYSQTDTTIHYGIKGTGGGEQGSGSGEEGVLFSPVITRSDSDEVISRVAVLGSNSTRPSTVPSSVITRSESDEVISRVAVPTGDSTPSSTLASSNPNEKRGITGPRLQSFPNDTLNLHRLTDSADADQLNIAPSTSPLLTANPTLWRNPTSAVPTLRHDSVLRVAFCTLGPLASLGELSTPAPPFLKMPVAPQMFYDPRKGPGAPLDAFEHLANYPHFPRIAIWYDSLPYRKGPVWGNFPAYSKWDTLAPKGKIRNMKGHEVAVAWREHGGEPYHYSVMSYDERGRVEALLRYSESLGFDAVYYSYNSANLVTSVRVADPFRQYTTFYGYNYNGQVDSVWTYLEGVGSGTVKMNAGLRADTLRRPLGYHRYDSAGSADMVYRYTALGTLERTKYPDLQITTDYWYNARGWLDSLETQYTIVAPKIFQQKLVYDEVGRIVSQESKNASQGSWLSQGYEYDAVDRLVGWSVGTDTTEYSYDEVGNRLGRMAAPSSTTYTYGAPSTGPNRIESSELVNGPNKHQTEYGYNLNGSVVERKVYDQMAVPLPSLLSEDYFGYSYRELNWRYVSGDPFSTNHSDWRYRYNAMGEREQKRLYHAPLPDSTAGQPYPWVYYLLGGSKDQLAVWHGQQMTSTFCDTVKFRNVFLYPTEYLTYGVGKQSSLITKPDGSKEYRFFDHLGSSRAVKGASGFTFTDYAPFGELLGGGTESRKGYIDKEKDGESSLRNHGVRLFDDEAGRFLSIDVLWESYNFFSPYQYSANNPLRGKDSDGMKIVFSDPTAEGEFHRTLAYLEENNIEDAKKMRTLLESDKYTIYLVNTSSWGLTGFSNEWKGGNIQTLYWNPFGAMKYEGSDGSTQVLSPGVGLLHESLHAWLELENPDFKQSLNYPTNDAFNNGEEKWTIERESAAGMQLGEITMPRTAWECGANDRMKCGVYFWTMNSITNTENKNSYKELFNFKNYTPYDGPKK